MGSKKSAECNWEDGERKIVDRAVVLKRSVVGKSDYNIAPVTVTDNSPFQDYPHPDDHTTRSSVILGFKLFTVKEKDFVRDCASKHLVSRF